MDPFVEWLKATALSSAINNSWWVWPLAETVHFIGLTLVIGVVGLFDLRLMGFVTRVPLAAARQLMPVALAGFALNLATGVVFLVGMPDQYVRNPAWWAKVFFLGVAGVNAMFFERIVGPQTLDAPDGSATPAAARIVGAVSLAAWFGVLYWGRMLPYLGNAF